MAPRLLVATALLAAWCASRGRSIVTSSGPEVLSLRGRWTMAPAPAPFASRQAYRNASMTTFGGGVVHWADGGQGGGGSFHLFANRLEVLYDFRFKVPDCRASLPY